MPRPPDDEGLPFDMEGIPEEESEHPRDAGNPEAFAKKMFSQLGGIVQHLKPPEEKWVQLTVTGMRKKIRSFPGMEHTPEEKPDPDDFEDVKPHRIVFPAHSISQVRELSSGGTEIDSMMRDMALRVLESLPMVLKYMGVTPNK